MTKNEILQGGKYAQKFIAINLYPDLEEKSAMAKLSNKLNNSNGRSLTQEEIERIKIILK